MKKDVLQLLSAIPIVIFQTVINVVISMIVSGEIGLQILSIGVSKNFAILISIIIAIVVYYYIAYNHKLVNLLK